MAEEKPLADNEDGSKPPAYSVLRLESDCTIREARELKRRLLEHLDAPAPLFVDGSAVERADTAGVQLLVAFSLDCLERGIAFAWPFRSAALTRAIDLLGVGALLECPGAVTVPPDLAPVAANGQQAG